MSRPFVPACLFSRLLLVIAAGFFLLPADAAWSADRNDTRTLAAATATLTTPTVDPRLRACVMIDPRTGAFAPCPAPTTAGAGRRGSASPPPPAPPLPSPIDFFDADQTIVEFEADPEQVLPNAYLLGQLSGMAYLGYEEAGEVASEIGFDESPSLLYGIETGIGHSKAYVVHDDDVVIVVFEGSTNGPGGTDWMQNNVQFDPVYRPAWGTESTTVCVWSFCRTVDVRQVRMHRGFVNAAEVIFDEVLEEIEPLLASGHRRLWLTGHSLGGAIAQITAFRLEFEEGIPVQGVHVFGAPAVGDAFWREVFEEEVTPNVHRWGLQYDPMPLLTAEPLFFHVGIRNNLYYDGDRVMDDADPLGGAPLCGALYNANYTHMLYWQRMQEEMLAADGSHGILLDEAMPTPSEPGCWFDF